MRCVLINSVQTISNLSLYLCAKVAGSQASTESNESVNLIRCNVQEAESEGTTPSVVQVSATSTENGSEMAEDDDNLTENFE